MLSGLISYFSSAGHESSQSLQSDKQEKEEEEATDWVYVDHSGQEISKDVADKELQLDDDNEDSKMSPLPLLDLTNKDFSPEDSPSLSPSRIEDGWYLTPPPCFTVNCPTKLEISPLEDLLIEHPSMSVYAKVPGTAQRSKMSLKSKALKAMPEEKALHEDNQPSPLPPTLHNAERTKSNLKTSTSVSIKPHELKNLLVQVENMKPAECAKYRKEQFKLRPSFIHRQNLVRSSRNMFNSKKKGIVKPFGEKCKRSF